MEENTRKILLLAAIVLIAGTIFLLENPFESTVPVLPDVGGKLQDQSASPYPIAPEIIGIHGWVNSGELKLADLRGKVVLVDFWTYSCINCLRTLPFLTKWHEKYADMGFVLIGVHSPEFEFEKILSNVEMAVKANGIEYPIALDNDMSTWKNYRNRFWPAKYLIDAKGRIRFTHFGEGAYEETEKQIRLLLEEATKQKVDVEVTKETQSPGVEGIFRTRELYAGYYWVGYIGNPGQFVFGAVNPFTDQQNHLDGLIYLQGNWFNSGEFVEHARSTQNLQDYVAINFLASEVNVVLGSGSEPYRVFVTVDGKKISQSLAGKDIKFDESQNGYVEVTQNRLYNIFKGVHGKMELKLASNSDEFKLYTFTFGG